MKLLLDTNIYIPLEPTSPEDVHVDLPPAAELSHLCHKLGFQLYVHGAQREDIRRDTNEGRRSLRLKLFVKYAVLPSRPQMPEHLRAIIPEPEAGTNNWVDYQLLTALCCGAVDYLVSNDDRLYRRAVRLGVGARVLTLGDAVAYLSSLVDRGVLPPPAVRSIPAYDLRLDDPIWESFRVEYPPFDVWLAKCRQEHRTTWIIDTADSGYAGVAIVKTEWRDGIGEGARILKVCSFKVSENHGGRKYGELLLKSVFCHAEANHYDEAYVTVFPRHGRLVQLLADFGFEQDGENERGEVVLKTPFRWRDEDRNTLDPLDFHVRFGPFVVGFDHADVFVVPIRPKFHAMLFPEAQDQLSMFPGEQSFGNTIRKAYLCHSAVRSLAPGSVLLFYRSEDAKAITHVGVVEEAVASSDSARIQALVMPRTVYSASEIQDMCHKETLAILYRQCLKEIPHVSLKEMREAGVLSGAPQTIMQLKGEAKTWTVNRLGM